MQSIRHPFVVRLHGAFQDARHFFYILEYMPGGDLYAALCRHGGTFPLDWCRVYVAEVALALERIHQLGFLYRDLKAENVLVASDGHLKVGDFGLATKGASGRAKSMAGTPFAMAPEMLHGDDYDAAVDWWALGVLFCEMALDPPPPWMSTSMSSIARLTLFESRRHLFELPVLLPRHKDSERAKRCITSLLSVDPAQRCRSVEMLQGESFYEDFDFYALLALQIPAPLAIEMRSFGSDLLSGHGSGNKGARPHQKGSQLKDVERAFKTFMDAEEVDAAAEGADRVDTSSTALCDAAARGDLAALRQIVGAGGDVDLGDYDRRTAMHLAASEGLLPIVRELIEQLSAAVSPYDRWGNTPLDDAARHGHHSVIAYLQSRGAVRGSSTSASSAGKGDDDDGRTAVGAPPALPSTAELCDAAARGDLDVLKRVASTSAGVRALEGADYDRRTPMHLAASEGRLEAVALMLRSGVARSPLDRWGHTPYDDAVRQGHKYVVGMLRGAGGGA